MTTTHITHRVIFDCDPGNGVPATDIDDGLALGLLLAAPQIQVEAVTIVSGNTHRDVGYDVARTMLEDIGVDVPVHAGSAEALVEPSAPWAQRREERRSSPEALELWDGIAPPRVFDAGHRYDAASEIVRRVSEAPGEITIVAVGPLTNIAHALQLRPELATEVRQILIMGGAFDVPGYLQELNFGIDPEAARIVLASGADIVLVPLDVTIQTTLTLEDVARLRDVGTPLASYLSSTTEPWIRYCEIFRELPGCRLHDPLAAALLLEPDLVQTERCSVDVQLSGTARSRPLRWNSDSLKLAAGIEVPSIPEISVAVGVDNARLVSVLVDVLSSGGE